MLAESGFDLLAVEARSTTPHLETACEVCLCEAARGRRVAFAFLDVAIISPHPIKDLIKRRQRLKRVRALERTLREHGVTVIPNIGVSAFPTPLTSRQLGIHSLDALRNLVVGDAALGLGVLSSLISFLHDTMPDVATHRALIDRLLASAQRAFTLTHGLIERHGPKSILVFNGRLAYSKGIVEAARLTHTGVLYHEISMSHERYYLEAHSVHNMRHAREMLHQAWAHGPDDRVRVGESFFSHQRVERVPLHAPYLAAQQDGRSVPLNGCRRIVYYASSVDEFAAVEDGLTPVAFETQFAALKWLAAWTRARPDTELIIRMHPRMRDLSRQELARWHELAGANVMLLQADSAIDSYALAGTADKVVVFHSTMGIEASYLGRPSILVGDAAYRGLDCVYEPGTPDELERLLLDDTLPPKPRENCLPYGYWLLTQGEPYRYYQPTSYTTGCFLGRSLPAADGLPFPLGLLRSLRRAWRRSLGNLLYRLESVRR